MFEISHARYVPSLTNKLIDKRFYAKLEENAGLCALFNELASVDLAAVLQGAIRHDNPKLLMKTIDQIRSSERGWFPDSDSESEDSNVRYRRSGDESIVMSCALVEFIGRDSFYAIDIEYFHKNFHLEYVQESKLIRRLIILYEKRSDIVTQITSLTKSRLDILWCFLCSDAPTDFVTDLMDTFEATDVKYTHYTERTFQKIKYEQFLKVITKWPHIMTFTPYGYNPDLRIATHFIRDDRPEPDIQKVKKRKLYNFEVRRKLERETNEEKWLELKSKYKGKLNISELAILRSEKTSERVYEILLPEMTPERANWVLCHGGWIAISVMQWLEKCGATMFTEAFSEMLKKIPKV